MLGQSTAMPDGKVLQTGGGMFGLIEALARICRERTKNKPDGETSS